MEFLLLWIVFAVVGAIVAATKGRSVAGWAALGFLFPPALLILLALERIKDVAAEATLPRNRPTTAPGSRDIRVADRHNKLQSAERPFVWLHHADRGSAFELSVDDIESVSGGGDGTVVWCGDHGYKVTETPSEIGLLIDRALGIATHA